MKSNLLFGVMAAQKPHELQDGKFDSSKSNHSRKGIERTEELFDKKRCGGLLKIIRRGK